MDHIKNLLSRRIKQSGLSLQVSNALIIEEFQKVVQEILGKAAGKKVKPLYLKNKVLNVVCLSSVISQEINLQKQPIIGMIQAKFGEDSINGIRFIV